MSRAAAFLREEQDVVRSIADMLSTYFERRLASAARQQSEERLKATDLGLMLREPLARAG